MRSRLRSHGVAGVLALGLNLLIFASLADTHRAEPSPRGERRPAQVTLAPDPEPPPPTTQPVPLLTAAAAPELPPMHLPQFQAATPVIARVSTEPVAHIAAVALPKLASLPQVLMADAVDGPPRELSPVAVAYPSAARRSGAEGLAELKLLIDERGRVEKVIIVRSVGHGQFGPAAAEAMRGVRFEPAQHQGRRVKVWAVKTIRFTLENR